MTDEELAEIESEVASWIFSRRTVGERLIAEVRRLKEERKVSLEYIGKLPPSIFTEDEL